MALRTDYKDDILDLTQNTQRKYRMITNDDGTVSFVDMTVYSQVGDSFGAAQLNEIANVVNEGSSNMYYDPTTDIKYLKNQEEKWVEVGKGGLLSLFIYPNTEAEALFGGITKDGWTSYTTSYPITNATITYQTDYYQQKGTDTTSAKGVSISAPSKRIDLTNYNKIKVKLKNHTTASAYLTVSETKNTKYSDVAEIPGVTAFVKFTTNSNIQEYSLDISNLSGSYYLCITGGTIDVYEWWLE